MISAKSLETLRTALAGITLYVKQSMNPILNNSYVAFGALEHGTYRIFMTHAILNYLVETFYIQSKLVKSKAVPYLFFLFRFTYGARCLWHLRLLPILFLPKEKCFSVLLQ